MKRHLNTLNNKLTTKHLILLAIICVILLFIVVLTNRKERTEVQDNPFITNEQSFSYSEALKNKSIKEVDDLVELPKDQAVKTAVIENVEELKKQNPLFNRAYDGDILIMYPDKTIIYDASTKTVRDIADVSLLKEE